MKNHKIYLSLGSNIGKKEVNLIKAITALDKLSKTTVCRVSNFYITKPVGNITQDDFLNCAVLIKSSLKPFQLLKEINRIEAELGRIRVEHWGPRTIDIDIIFYGTIKIENTTLKIPHKEYKNRNFVMNPLYEIMNRSERAIFLRNMDKTGIQISTIKTVIGISSCLAGINSKYSGSNNYIPLLKKLSNSVFFVPFCPEQLGGMSTPRERSEISGSRVITQSGSDVTEQFRAGAAESKKILEIAKCELVILKSKSPSCGLSEIYDGTFSSTLLKRSGVTAELLCKNGFEIIEI